jgi:hypothetical protein
MLDFVRIKEIKLTDVVARYKIALRFKGEYAVCACPLPTHKQGDTGKSFSIHLGANYWRCFSDSCNANNGGKRGGDVINFVALMEGCRERDGAQKLADWYGINQTTPRREPVKEAKTPQHIAEGSKEKPKTQMQRTISQSDSPAVAVKSGFMHETGLWLDELLAPIVENLEIRKTLKKAVMDRVHQSYLNGRKVLS